MRILVTGSREWESEDAIRDAIAGVSKSFVGPHTLVHGACETGADPIAERVASAMGFEIEPYPADWETCHPLCPSRPHRRKRQGKEYCPLAGIWRNAEMVKTGADVCLAFPLPSSRGTYDCISKAQKAGITVMIFGQTGDLIAVFEKKTPAKQTPAGTRPGASGGAADGE